LGEKANPPIDLPQPPLAVPIVCVITAIAVAGGPRHHLRHGRAFAGEQKPVLIFEALQPARRDVVLDMRREFVRFWFSGKAFSHLVVFPGSIQWSVPNKSGGTLRTCLIFSRLPVIGGTAGAYILNSFGTAG